MKSIWIAIKNNSHVVYRDKRRVRGLIALPGSVFLCSFPCDLFLQGRRGIVLASPGSATDNNLIMKKFTMVLRINCTILGLWTKRLRSDAPESKSRHYHVHSQVVKTFTQFYDTRCRFGFPTVKLDWALFNFISSRTDYMVCSSHVGLVHVTNAPLTINVRSSQSGIWRNPGSV